MANGDITPLYPDLGDQPVFLPPPPPPMGMGGDEQLPLLPPPMALAPSEQIPLLPPPSAMGMPAQIPLLPPPGVQAPSPVVSPTLVQAQPPVAAEGPQPPSNIVSPNIVQPPVVPEGTGEEVADIETPEDQEARETEEREQAYRVAVVEGVVEYDDIDKISDPITRDMAATKLSNEGKIENFEQVFALETPEQKEMALAGMAQRGVPGAAGMWAAQKQTNLQLETQTKAAGLQDQYEGAKAKRKQEAQAQKDEQKLAVEAAQAVVAEKQKAVDTLRKKGEGGLGKRQIWALAIKAMGQALASGFDTRIGPPDISGDIQNMLGRNARLHAQKIAEAEKGVAEAGVEVTREGGELQAVDRDAKLLEASYYAELGEAIGKVARDSKSEAARMNASMVSQTYLQKALDKSQEAGKIEEGRQYKLADQQADIDLKRAKAKKLRDDAARLARRGLGGGGRRGGSARYPQSLRDAVSSGMYTKKEADSVFKTMVIDPTTGKPTERKDGTFAVTTSPAIAAQLNEAGARLKSSNDMINQAVAMRGKAGWEPTDSFASSENGRRMSGLSTHLLFVYQQEFGLGVLSESDEKLLLRVMGGKLAGYPDPRKTLQDLQKRAVASYNTRRTSLAPGSQPIDFAKARSIPKANTANLRIKLKQSKFIPTKEIKFSLDQLRDKLIEEEGGIEKGTNKWVGEVEVTLKRHTGYLEEAEKKLKAALPKNYDELKADVARAEKKATLENDPDSYATPETILEADRALALARKELKGSLSPGAKELLSQRNARKQSIVEIEKQLGENKGMQLKAKILRAKETKDKEERAKRTESYDVN